MKRRRHTPEQVIRKRNLELFSCLAEAQVVIEDWRQDYNQRRPHSALGRKAPAVFAAAWTPETPAA